MCDPTENLWPPVERYGYNSHIRGISMLSRDEGCNEFPS